MTLKPRLIISDEPRNIGLAATTYESRKGMSPAQLIKLMGPLHVSHPDYKPRPRKLIAMPNLAGKQPTIARYSAGFLADLKRAFLGGLA